MCVTWITKKGGDIVMVKRKEAIPEHFKSDEEAGEFWDTHSAGDYWEEMEEVEMEFDIQNHKFLVPINERIYQLIKIQAEKKDCSVEQIINELLDHSLIKMK